MEATGGKGGTRRTKPTEGAQAAGTRRAAGGRGGAARTPTYGPERAAAPDRPAEPVSAPATPARTETHDGIWIGTRRYGPY